MDVMSDVQVNCIPEVPWIPPPAAVESHSCTCLVTPVEHEDGIINSSGEYYEFSWKRVVQ